MVALAQNIVITWLYIFYVLEYILQNHVTMMKGGDDLKKRYYKNWVFDILLIGINQ